MESLYTLSNSSGSASIDSTCRAVISAGLLARRASTVRVRLMQRPGNVWTVRAAIGLRATSGDPYDIDPATLVVLTCGGAQTWVVSNVDAATTYTDPLPFYVDGTRDIVISVYRVSGTMPYKFGAPPAGFQTYTKSGDLAYTANVSSAVTNTDRVYAFWALEGEGDILQPVAGAIEQGYGLFGEHVCVQVPANYYLTDAVGQGVLAQPWGLRMSRDLVEPWANAPVRVAGLAQPWRDAGELARGLVQPWQDAAPLSAGLAQEWDILGALAAQLVQPWAIAADAALVGSLAQGWDLRDVVPLSVPVVQPWSIGEDGSLLRYAVSVSVDGVAIGISHLNIEADRAQDVLSCEIHPETEGDWLRCRFGAALVVTITSDAGTETFRFVVTAPRISEQHGEPRWVVEAMSPAALLGDPWGVPVSGELSGLASQIAADLVAGSGVALTWATVDWAIPAACWIAADERPLALLKTLAAAVGAVVQSQPDGSLRIEPDYPVPLPRWASTAPGLGLTETLDVFSVSSDPDYRPGYNRYLVGDQGTAAAAEGLRLEEETISATVKLCRGYQVPWIGAFTLAHTGGDWVQVEALGIETRQETEVVEFVAGSGRTRYPIYSRDAIAWLQTNLGTVTVAEDGTLSSAIAGQSLLRITYTTRCRKWRVRDARNEQLQLVAEL